MTDSSVCMCACVHLCIHTIENYVILLAITLIPPYHSAVDCMDTVGEAKPCAAQRRGTE